MALALCLAIFSGGNSSLYAQSFFLDDEIASYVFESVNTSVVVNLDNSYDVVETFVATFEDEDYVGEKFGIIRYLEKVIALDLGNASRVYYPRISNIVAMVEMDGNIIPNAMEIIEESDYLHIVLGNENFPVNQKTVTYTIRYKYAVGNDRISEKDFFYFNLHGHDWDADVKDFAFDISFPHSFEIADYNFFVGGYGESGQPSLDIVSSVVGNKLIGQYNKETLNSFTAVTIMMDLPEGAFSQVPEISYNSDIVAIVLLAILVIIAFAIISHWNKKAKNIHKPVEFYPPNGLNPPETVFVGSGKLDAKKMTSLVIYWASKKRLKIIQTSDKKIELEKIDELDEKSPAYEKNIFANLFSGKSKVDISEQNEELAKAMYQGVASAKGKHKNTIVSTGSKAAAIAVMALGLIPFFVLGIVYVLKTGYITFIGISMFLMILSGVVVFFTMSSYLAGARFSHRTKRKRVQTTIVLLLLMAFLMFINGVLFQIDILDKFGLKFIAPAVSVCILFLSSFVPHIRDDIAELFGRVQGFREFILLAEKDRIVVLVDENPAYFYDILPYAYVFDITDKFSKKFEGLYFPTMESYQMQNTSLLEVVIISNMIQSSFNHSLKQHAINNMSKNVRSGLGGGMGGGGGFSGGGFGGGGGRSW